MFINVIFIVEQKNRKTEKQKKETALQYSMLCGTLSRIGMRSIDSPCLVWRPLLVSYGSWTVLPGMRERQDELFIYTWFLVSHVFHRIISLSVTQLFRIFFMSSLQISIKGTVNTDANH